MFPLSITHDLELRVLNPIDADPMYTLISANRQHLDSWLRWSGRIQSVADTRALIEQFTEKYTAGDGFHAGIWYNGTLAGGLVCHFINRLSYKSEIGYWLARDYTGKGIVTRACREVITRLFNDEKMHRIEIQCMVENRASRAVAERLGFTFEGIKRESELINGAFRDHALYAMLVQDWHYNSQ